MSVLLFFCILSDHVSVILIVFTWFFLPYLFTFGKIIRIIFGVNIRSPQLHQLKKIEYLFRVKFQLYVWFVCLIVLVRFVSTGG